MILITGGAFAGKTAYAVRTFGIPEEGILDGASCSPEAVLTAGCIRNYQILVRRLLSEGDDPMAFTEHLIRKNPEIVVILNEIGCGIIPLEREERIWREHTGWCGCLLAEHAEAVIRICCGCASVIKGNII